LRDDSHKRSGRYGMVSGTMRDWAYAGGKGDGPMLPGTALWCATRQEPGGVKVDAASYKYSLIVQQVYQVRPGNAHL